jgi:hypothetical protein
MSINIIFERINANLDKNKRNLILSSGWSWDPGIIDNVIQAIDELLDIIKKNKKKTDSKHLSFINKFEKDLIQIKSLLVSAKNKRAKIADKSEEERQNSNINRKISIIIGSFNDYYNNKLEKADHLKPWWNRTLNWKQKAIVLGIISATAAIPIFRGIFYESKPPAEVIHERQVKKTERDKKQRELSVSERAITNMKDRQGKPLLTKNQVQDYFKAKHYPSPEHERLVRDFFKIVDSRNNPIFSGEDLIDFVNNPHFTLVTANLLKEIRTYDKSITFSDISNYRKKTIKEDNSKVKISKIGNNYYTSADAISNDLINKEYWQIIAAENLLEEFKSNPKFDISKFRK